MEMQNNTRAKDLVAEINAIEDQILVLSADRKNLYDKWPELGFSKKVAREAMRKSRRNAEQRQREQDELMMFFRMLGLIE
jgi:uncharacterized protein (UPF0335 family)